MSVNLNSMRYYTMEESALDRHIAKMVSVEQSHVELQPISMASMEKENLAIKGRIAVVTIDDVIEERNYPGAWGIPANLLGQLVSNLGADNSVGAIVLDISSPGGSAMGTPEAADQIRAVRGKKPVIAVANAMAFSGGYWLASAADEVVVTPSGSVGSVGVIARHVDLSGALEEAGIKVTSVKSVEHKQATTNPYEPLSEAGREQIQERVNEIHDAFVTALARNRGVTKDHVRSNFGDGKTFSAKKAVSLGMADRVATFDTVIRELARARQKTLQRKNTLAQMRAKM